MEIGSPGLPTDLSVRYSAEILDALAYLHERDILHRDLSPDNVLLSAHDHCKLADLGLAQKMSIVGTFFVGKFSYMAPEVVEPACEGEIAQYGAAADIYSFGILVFFMVSGGAPSEPSSLAGSLGSLRPRVSYDLGMFKARVSPDLATVMDLTTAHNPDNRASLEELRKASFFHDISWTDLRAQCQEHQITPASAQNSTIGDFMKDSTLSRSLIAECESELSSVQASTKSSGTHGRDG